MFQFIQLGCFSLVGYLLKNWPQITKYDHQIRSSAYQITRSSVYQLRLSHHQIIRSPNQIIRLGDNQIPKLDHQIIRFMHQIRSSDFLIYICVCKIKYSICKHIGYIHTIYYNVYVNIIYFIYSYLSILFHMLTTVFSFRIFKTQNLNLLRNSDFKFKHFHFKMKFCDIVFRNYHYKIKHLLFLSPKKTLQTQTFTVQNIQRCKIAISLFSLYV